MQIHTVLTISHQFIKLIFERRVFILRIFMLFCLYAASILLLCSFLCALASVLCRHTFGYCILDFNSINVVKPLRTLFFTVHGSEDEERLMIDAFRGYNSLVQPIRARNDTPITVKFALQLILLINVDEKNQIMHTNVWLTLKWPDYQMVWNPVKYGEIKQMRVSPDKLWLPDIVLFNNADGNYEVSYYSNVVIEADGAMLWVPPAIYKSSCIIDVEFFPFDEQTCHLIFGSWTYNDEEVKLELDGRQGVDLSEYSASSIWDIIDVPAVLVSHRSRIEYQIRIRRKTLFYTVVLIIPTVLMAFLSMAVFFLPADSGEKITLTISVLLSINVSKILPPTSKTIPLMAKYLLLTLVLNVFTILVTVVVINVYFRGPTTHTMPSWLRKTFLDFMPKVLGMKRPRPASSTGRPSGGACSGEQDTSSTFGGSTANNSRRGANTSSRNHHPQCNVSGGAGSRLDMQLTPTTPHDRATHDFYPLTQDAQRAIDAIEYITEHLKQDEEYKMIREDWKYVAMILDRLLLYVFFGVTLGGTLGILLSAKNVFEFIDQEEVIERLKQKYGVNAA